MAREIGGWLSGSKLPSPGPDSGGREDQPGRRFGLPAAGAGSLARLGRRIAALCLDWFIAYGIGALSVSFGLMSGDQFRYDWTGSATVMAVWAALGIAGVRLFGFSPGQYMLGLQLVSVDNRRHVGLGRAAVRVLLIALIVPALFTDTDGRGLHDRVTATAVVRR